LTKLAEFKGAPLAAKSATDQFYAQFPTLKDMRDTVQHVEDRGLGLGKNGKPLDLKPVDNGMIKAPRGAIGINNLNGNKYGNTASDGHYKEAAVSGDSLVKARDCIQHAINAFRWTGGMRHHPT
jgi:hypothetical protein